MSQMENWGEKKGKRKNFNFCLLYEDFKMMLVVSLKEEEVKHNFHVEKDSLAEKVLGFWVVICLTSPNIPNSTNGLVFKGINSRLRYIIFFFLFPL